MTANSAVFIFAQSSSLSLLSTTFPLPQALCISLSTRCPQTFPPGPGHLTPTSSCSLVSLSPITPIVFIPAPFPKSAARSSMLLRACASQPASLPCWTCLDQFHLPFSWHEFGVTKEVFLNEESDFRVGLATMWKQDPEFALEVAFFRWKFLASSAPDPIPPEPVIPATSASSSFCSQTSSASMDPPSTCLEQPSSSLASPLLDSQSTSPGPASLQPDAQSASLPLASRLPPHSWLARHLPPLSKLAHCHLSPLSQLVSSLDPLILYLLNPMTLQWTS